MQKKTFLRTLALLVPITLMSLTACGKATTGEEGKAKFLDYAGINKEYQESIAKLEFPPDFTPPTELKGEAQEGRFQAGYGDTRASMQYECAWEREWLNTYASDPQRAAKAMTHLEKIPSMGYMNEPRADESTRRSYQDYLDKAKLGDPSGFQENVSLNCP